MRKSRPIMPVLLAAIVMTIVAQAAEKEAPKSDEGRRDLQEYAEIKSFHGFLKRGFTAY